MDEDSTQLAQGTTSVKTKKHDICRQDILYKTYITKLDLMTIISKVLLNTITTQYYQDNEHWWKVLKSINLEFNSLKDKLMQRQ